MHVWKYVKNLDKSEELDGQLDNQKDKDSSLENISQDIKQNKEQSESLDSSMNQEQQQEPEKGENEQDIDKKTSSGDDVQESIDAESTQREDKKIDNNESGQSEKLDDSLSKDSSEEDSTKDDLRSSCDDKKKSGEEQYAEDSLVNNKGDTQTREVIDEQESDEKKQQQPSSQLNSSQDQEQQDTQSGSSQGSKSEKKEESQSSQESDTQNNKDGESQEKDGKQQETQSGGSQGSESESVKDGSSQSESGSLQKDSSDGRTRDQQDVQNGNNQGQGSNISQETDSSSLTSSDVVDKDEKLPDSVDNKTKNDTQQGDSSSAKSKEDKVDDKDGETKQDSLTDLSDEASENSNGFCDEHDDRVDGEEKEHELFDEDGPEGLEQHVVNSENTDERLQRIKDLRDRLLEYARKKQQDEEKQRVDTEKSRLQEATEEAIESEEEKYELSEHTNQFLDSLKELPSFKDRSRGPGYGIDTDGYTDVSDSVIRTLISKFLNRRFCKRDTDLNVRSNSLKKARGFYRWEVKDVITHLKTHQVTKVLDDKYGYQYANGKNENVPLSFYFDLSCSMSKYSNLLAVIAIELLKKGVKVLIGFNERVNVQIDSIKNNVDVLDLARMLQTAGYSAYASSTSRSRLSNNGLFKFKFIDENLDNYLIKKGAEKCVVFADFDPVDEVCNLSLATDVYWFCFEDDFSKIDASRFHGFIYKVKDEDDIARGLIKVSDNKFEALCFTDNPKEFVKRKE